MESEREPAEQPSNGATREDCNLPASEEQRPPLDRLTSHPYHTITTRIRTRYLSALLVLLPVAIMAGILGWPGVVVFGLNLIVIVALISWITFSIGELSTRIGRFLDEILKATLGNTVEMLVSIVALVRGKVHMVQSILVGSIVCYALLVLGFSIFLSGYGKERVAFDRTLTSILSSLVLVVTVCQLIPTAMYAFPPDDGDVPGDTYFVSQVTAVTLFLLLLVFFYFQLQTHATLFRFSSNRSSSSDRRAVGASLATAGSILVIATLTALACSVYLVDSVDRMVEQTRLSQSFINIVLIPLIGNATKYVIIIILAQKGQVDYTMRAIIGSILRITLLITPVLVLLGWTLDRPLTLQFDVFEATMFFLAVIVMNYLIQDGRSNYFEGLMLIGTYVIISMTIYLRPMAPNNVIFI